VQQGQPNPYGQQPPPNPYGEREYRQPPPGQWVAQTPSRPTVAPRSIPVVTLDALPGREIAEIVGDVVGVVARSRDLPPELRGGGMEAGYVAMLTDKIVGAVWEAQRSMRPARIASGIGHSTVGLNRRMWHPGQQRIVLGRNYGGFVDHDLPVARGRQHEGIACFIQASRRNGLAQEDRGFLSRTSEMEVKVLASAQRAVDEHPLHDRTRAQLAPS
jgi:hypothetical protein